jgi:hypothetical protein
MSRLDFLKEMSRIVVLALQVKNAFVRVRMLNSEMDELYNKLNL